MICQVVEAPSEDFLRLVEIFEELGHWGHCTRFGWLGVEPEQGFEESELPVFGVSSKLPKPGMLLDGAGVVVGDELGLVGVGVVLLVVGFECLDEVGLDLIWDDLVGLVVHSQERDGLEGVEVGWGVDGFDFGSVVVDTPEA